MSGQANAVSGTTGRTSAAGDRRSRRRAETQREIVAAAWDLVRVNGLAGLAMRDLGDRVGMRAQSVYGYFASKNDIYDAMFAEGYSSFLEWMDTPVEGDARLRLQHLGHRFFAFCTSDPVRYQLMFQRTIPGFVPSAESYALAVQALELLATDLAGIGITDPDAVDLVTAVMTGLTSQQISNDPGGQRWQRLVDPAVDMLLATLVPTSRAVRPRSSRKDLS